MPTYSAILTGTGSSLPEKRLTNDDLAKMVDTNDEWITQRTGIKERRIVSEGESTASLGTAAARRAMEASGVDPKDIGAIICATITPEMVFPSTACFIGAELGLIGAAAFDLSAACSGFIYALTTGASLIKSGQSKSVLVVGAETLSRIVNYKDRASCILFGDGAGAVVLQRTDRPGGLRSFVLGSDGCGAPRLFVPAGGSKVPASQESVEARSHFLKMEGSNVFRFATKVIPGSIIEALEKAGLTSADLGLVIPHQANIRIIDHAREKLNLPAERVFTNVDRYGNTSAASIPVALCEALEEGRIADGDIVAMCAFGAGLCWAAAVWEWN